MSDKDKALRKLDGKKKIKAKDFDWSKYKVNPIDLAILRARKEKEIISHD